MDENQREEIARKLDMIQDQIKGIKNHAKKIKINTDFEDGYIEQIEESSELIIDICESLSEAINRLASFIIKIELAKI